MSPALLVITPVPTDTPDPCLFESARFADFAVAGPEERRHIAFVCEYRPRPLQRTFLPHEAVNHRSHIDSCACSAHPRGTQLTTMISEMPTRWRASGAKSDAGTLNGTCASFPASLDPLCSAGHHATSSTNILRKQPVWQGVVGVTVLTNGRAHPRASTLISRHQYASWAQCSGMMPDRTKHQNLECCPIPVTLGGQF